MSDRADRFPGWRPALAALILAPLATVSPGAARAQTTSTEGTSGNIAGITVNGEGTASARPNRFEIELSISAASELTADAIVKYRDARRRVLEAFEALKLENVGVEERGLLVDRKGVEFNPYYGGMSQPNDRTRAEVQLSRKLVVQASEIREMDEEVVLQLVGRLLDVAQDAGAQVGSGSPNMRNYYYGYPQQGGGGLVRFVLEGYDALLERAYEAAIADARSRAERLAKLGGVELGAVLGVRELSVPGASKDASNPMSPFFMPPPEDEDEDQEPVDRIVSDRFQTIPVRVELQVRFEVIPRRAVEAAPAEADAGALEQ